MVDHLNKLEKYKELYNLSKEAFNEELSRSHRIDQKATTYLAVLTFLLGILSFFGTRLIDSIFPPNDFLEWCLLVFCSSLLILIVFTWFVLFRVLKVHEFSKIPIDIQYFYKNELIDVYYGFSKGMNQNLSRNREIGDKKSLRLYKGYILIRVIVIFIAIFSFIFIGYSYKKSKSENNNQREALKMAKYRENPKDSNDQSPKKPQSEGQSETEPNLDIIPPTFDVVTEGYKPHKTQIKGHKNDK